MNELAILILAGGYGTRMGVLTKTVPKPLLPIDGAPIIEHLIDSVRRSGGQERDIVVAVRYLKEPLIGLLREEHPMVQIIEPAEDGIIEAVTDFVAKYSSEYRHVIGLSCDLVHVEALGRVRERITSSGCDGVLLFTSCVEEDRKQKYWEYVVRDARLTDLKKGESLTYFEKIGLGFSMSALVSACPAARAVARAVVDGTASEPYAAFRDSIGWNLLVKVAIDRGMVFLAEECSSDWIYNVNTPAHLSEASAVVQRWRRGV